MVDRNTTVSDTEAAVDADLKDYSADGTELWMVWEQQYLMTKIDGVWRIKETENRQQS